jgi:hypothetical protein
VLAERRSEGSACTVRIAPIKGGASVPDPDSQGWPSDAGAFLGSPSEEFRNAAESGVALAAVRTTGTPAVTLTSPAEEEAGYMWRRNGIRATVAVRWRPQLTAEMAGLHVGQLEGAAGGQRDGERRELVAWAEQCHGSLRFGVMDGAGNGR